MLQSKANFRLFRLFFLKVGHYFRLFNTVASTQMFHIKVCRWLDSNRGPLVSEATALPTEPQPLSLSSYTANFFRIVCLKADTTTTSCQRRMATHPASYTLLIWTSNQGPPPILKFKCEFLCYANFSAFWLVEKIEQPIRMLKNDRCDKFMLWDTTRTLLQSPLFYLITTLNAVSQIPRHQTCWKWALWHQNTLLWSL